jgi:hypothetical protein
MLAIDIRVKNGVHKLEKAHRVEAERVLTPCGMISKSGRNDQMGWNNET